MNLKIFNGLPAYVRITILSQIRRLLSTSLFNYEDSEDIAQELLLFYLKRFYTIPDVDEALVVHSLKQYTTNLLKKRCNRRDYLNSSLDYDTFDEEFFLATQDYDNITKTTLSMYAEQFDDKEKQIFELLYEGYSANQISATLHIHKRVIRRFVEKLRNILT